MTIQWLLLLWSKDCFSLQVCPIVSWLAWNLFMEYRFSLKLTITSRLLSIYLLILESFIIMNWLIPMYKISELRLSNLMLHISSRKHPSYPALIIIIMIRCKIISINHRIIIIIMITITTTIIIIKTRMKVIWTGSICERMCLWG